MRSSENIFQTPFSIKPINFRFFVVTNISYILAFILHILFLGFFLYVGISFMAFFNIGSCVIFVICFIANRNGFHKTAILTGIAEVILHALFGIAFVGWESGFSYYIFCLVPLLFYIPRFSLPIKIGITVLTLAIFVAAYSSMRLMKPYFVIDGVLLLGCNYVNLISLFIVLSCVAYYYSLAAHQAQEEVERQYKVSENLLLNIFPQKIADKLKVSSGVIAEKHPAATILFADIVEFTKLTRHNEPVKVVRFLNRIFSDFDAITERLGLEKIKTIGDAYMAAGGLPDPRPDHAEAIAELALGMRDTVRAFNAKAGKNILRIRIGINTGSVIAGVIGKKKFTYDLWGDSVNIAARMESLCPENKIHVSGETARFLDRHFLLDFRGEIEVKGFDGRMRTYFLEDRRPVQQEARPDWV